MEQRDIFYPKNKQGLYACIPGPNLEHREIASNFEGEKKEFKTVDSKLGTVLKAKTNSDEVFDLLEAWGLGDLKVKFKTNYVDIEVLHYLTEADIVELIPRIGQRALFRARLNQWLRQKSDANIHVPLPKKIKLEPENEVKSQTLQPIKPMQLMQPMQAIQPIQSIQSLQAMQSMQSMHSMQSMQSMKPQQLIQPNNPIEKQQKSKIIPQVNGNLTKIVPKPKARRINKKVTKPNSPPNMQSKVQQFYIGSPPSTTGTVCQLPSPPNLTPVSFPKMSISAHRASPVVSNIPLHFKPQRFPYKPTCRFPNSSQLRIPVSSASPNVINSDNFGIGKPMVRLPWPADAHVPSEPSPTLNETDLTPFATSIIRVQTNCEANNASNDNSMSSNPAPKLYKRTTITQKLKADSNISPPQPQMKKPSLVLKPIEQLRNSPEIPKSPEVPRPKQVIIPKDEPIDLDDDSFYTTDWNSSSEKQTSLEPVVQSEPEKDPEIVHEPEIEQEVEPEPEAELQPEPEPNPEVEEFTLADDVTEIPELIKDEIIDSDHETTQPPLLKEMEKSQNHSPNVEKDPKETTNRLDIRNILMESKNGRRVLKRYVAEEILDEPTRKLLVEVVAQYCFDNKVHITPTYCKDIAEEIIEIFPNERVDDYFPKSRKIRPPIYSKFYTIRRESLKRKSLPAQTVPKTTNKEENDEDDNLIIS